MPTEAADGSDARLMIQQMLSDGDITKEEAADLLQALDDDPATEEEPTRSIRREVRRTHGGPTVTITKTRRVVRR